MPKIWGNTRRHHLTALLAASLGIGCTESAGPLQFREIRAHFLQGCEPREDTRDAQIDLQALGDFDPSLDTFETFTAAVSEAPLVIPMETRAVALKAHSNFEQWSGLASAAAAGNVDIGLWPASAACGLFTADDGRYPGSGSGAAVGYAPGSATLLVSGGQGAASTSAMTVNLTTGISAEVTPEDGPRTTRSGGTVTAFGGDLLVAGGADPDTAVPLDSADVFLAAEGRFDPNRIDLSRPRARHAAVELASGETLLVGGIDTSGRALPTLEVVSPAKREYRISGLARLEHGRIDPVALRLSDDTVLVAGGTDDGGAPVETLEWLAPDASAVTRTSADLGALGPPTVGRAFVAMPGGGALAVGGCTLRAPDAGDAAACTAACTAGCPSRDVLWILPDGKVQALPDALDVDAPNPRLVTGAGGRPWLLAGPPGARTFRVFDPFRSRFVVPNPAPAAPTSDLALLPLDAGAFAWLATDGTSATVGGFRHGVRGPYTAADRPLLLQNNDGTALDRPLPTAETIVGVTLRAPEAHLVLTDTTYQTLKMSLEIAIAGEGAPVVTLGGRDYGGDDCPWPGTDETTFVVTRSAAAVRLERGGESRSCAPPEGRVSVSIHAPSETTITQIAVQRDVD